MSAALASLLALLAAIGLSMTTRINVGLVAIGLAWAIGVYAAGLTPDAVMAGFPVSLFLTLTGVTLLFAVAECNGTLGRVAHRACRLARGDARVLPATFFFVACAVSTAGPGAIASVALIAPVAMAIGARAGVPAALTALMVANGANAGNLAPFSSVGIIANSAMARAGLGGHAFKVWFANFAAHVLVGVLAWLLFARPRPATAGAADPAIAGSEPLEGLHIVTAAAILLWIAGVVGAGLPLGLSAFAFATVLFVLGLAEEGTAIRRVPWAVILMVCGVTVLIALLEKTGGMELFTSLLARLATPATLNGVIAFVTGAISSYSSTSGVVLPAFLPTVPGLVREVGGGDPLAVALSINVGASLVDVSPLSTLGALCVAAVPDPADAKPLFRVLLAWGLSMAVAGAVLCQLLAGVLAGA
jgi:Na+/H+ antiporter NhaD/arsenite permease-like protein